MKIYDCEQRSDEWFQVRLGKFTASKAADLLMKETTVGYNNLINQIVYERLTSKSPETFTNDWMQRGTELEAEAIKAFELETFQKVKPIGFIEMDQWTGASPDGLINDDGLIQIKCPKFSTHIDYLLSGKVPDNYFKQCQFELMVTERKYNIFMSYEPNLRSFISKIKPDEELISQIKIKLQKSIKLINERIILLKEQ